MEQKAKSWTVMGEIPGDGHPVRREISGSVLDRSRKEQAETMVITSRQKR